MQAIIFLLFGMIFLFGCESFTKRHATRAILFSPGIVEDKAYSSNMQRGSQEAGKNTLTQIPNAQSLDECGKRDIFLPVKAGSLLYSGNPVYINNNTKFSVRIDEVNPGWIYKAKSQQKPNSGAGHPNSLAHGSSGKAQDPISQEQFDHFRGHELWLLTTISSVNVNDPLETKSKRYFKATNVKFDSQSYSLLPLDSEEKYVFTHESDSSYRITFQLFKVDQFALKKELAKIGRNPGIVGAGKALMETLRNTAGALVGDVLQSVWEEKASEGLALERFLLSIKATVEFHGELVVLRDGDFQNRSLIWTPDEVSAILDAANLKKDASASSNYALMKPFVETSYMLLDYFKYSAKDKDKALNHHNEDSYNIDPYAIIDNVSITNNFVCKDSKKEEKIDRYAYIKFSVLQSHSAKSYIDDKGNVRSSQIPETYVNTLNLVENIFKDKSTVEQEIAKLEAEKELEACKSDAACITEKNKRIDENKKRLPSDTRIRVLESAYGKYKSEIKLDEWKAHLTRQPD